jgi:hypothetical protein
MGYLSNNFSMKRCEPGIAHQVLEPEPVFGNRGRKPVSAELDGDGEFSTPGIAFDDYSRMTVQQRRTLAKGRRLPTPSWAVNVSEQRSLLVRFFEARACIRKPGPGSDIQRLNNAQRVLLASVPAKIEVLDKLCREYVAVKSADPARAKILRMEIANIDTAVRMARMGAGGIARMIHLYYSVGLDSVGTASEIGVTPQHVRQIIYRLHRLVKRMKERQELCTR